MDRVITLIPSSLMTAIIGVMKMGTMIVAWIMMIIVARTIVTVAMIMIDLISNKK